MRYNHTRYMRRWRETRRKAGVRPMELSEAERDLVAAIRAHMREASEVRGTSIQAQILEWLRDPLRP